MSPKYTLNQEDGRKIFTGLAIALLGALATYLQDTIPNIDFGAYTPVAVAVNSVLVNIIRKFIVGL